MAKINLFDLEPENVVGSMAGQKLYLYSVNNCGKTKVASKLPKALLMMRSEEHTSELQSP